MHTCEHTQHTRAYIQTHIEVHRYGWLMHCAHSHACLAERRPAE